MDQPESQSRRAWIKKALMTGAAITAYPILSRGAQAAVPKLAKAAVHYQDHPKGHKMCGMCAHFIPPGGTAGHGMMGGMHTMGPGMMQGGTCQLVQGPITPKGYCLLYKPVRS